ncbi:conserved hypothetical protein [Leishmania braziliensis MHOM/BR/75/M2904]|uniref:Uncharacterized protein n=3 Tax=Leishmania braziliensis TaxID=5660 RepID=E9AIG8_LEIBR|nr:conserved hypothetical protein [Leishmania braziliensis MHOM/BR/75/M2904]CAJ2473609.1 unnamed protein product [Leishmania braziliensis]CBZ14612.1 conserved hypothetical protein [Leishmania braziliensis MHOM/BR/75/M2904]
MAALSAAASLRTRAFLFFLLAFFSPSSHRASSERTGNAPTAHFEAHLHTISVGTLLFPTGTSSGMRTVRTRLVSSTAASLHRSHCRSRAYYFGAAGAAVWHRCRRLAGVTTTTTHIASAAVSASPSSLSTARRTYYWPYPENLVPEGATTSPFQSSPVPSVRERIIREYALGPLFGSRTPCCMLGFADTARDVVERKGDVRQWVARALGKVEVDVELGALVQTKEMLLHRSGTDESPRLADGAGSRPDAELRRVTRYARLPVQARTLLEVYLPGEEQDEMNAAEDVDAIILAHGYFLQQQFYRYMTASPSSAPGYIGQSGIEGSTREEAVSKMQPHSREYSKGDDEADVKLCVTALHDTCGVIYCEVPVLDESDFVFDKLHGKEVDCETAERVMNRWTRRGTQQQ